MEISRLGEGDEGEVGEGQLEVQASWTHFTELSSCYPLKLLTPRPYRCPSSNLLLQAVYMLNYGGGLVHGDRIKLTVHLDPHTRLLALTQGSTKVFKEPHLIDRPSPTPNTIDSTKKTGHSQPLSITKQILTAHLSRDSILLILPSPVTCFRDSNYSQIQRFHLNPPNSSALVLDWITSGRRHHHQDSYSSHPEHWTFHRYRSTNEFYHQPSSTLILRDTLTLVPKINIDSYYSIYATIYLILSPHHHPQLLRLLSHFTSLNRDRENQTFPPNRRQQASVDGRRRILWSFSRLDPEEAEHEFEIGIVRVAGVDSVEVKDWIVRQLGGLVELVGPDLFQNAF